MFVFFTIIKFVDLLFFFVCVASYFFMLKLMQESKLCFAMLAACFYGCWSVHYFGPD